MATFTNDWDEAALDDNTYADTLDTEVNNVRIDVSDRLSDMVYGFTAGENDGVQGFKQLEFKQQDSAASQPSADEIVLYAIDDGSNCGLYAKEENNNAAQILKYDGTNFGLNGAAIIPDTVDEDAIRLDNNSYLTARNAANDDDVNCIKINASDVPEILVGAVLSASTAPGSDPAIANKKYVDDQVDTKNFGTLTANDSDTNALAKTNVYKATSDGFVMVMKQCTGTNTQEIQCYVGATSSPATLIQTFAGANTHYNCCMFPIGTNEYWKVTSNTTGDPTIYWQPIGSGECQKQ